MDKREAEVGDHRHAFLATDCCLGCVLPGGCELRGYCPDIRLYIVDGGTAFSRSSAAAAGPLCRPTVRGDDILFWILPWSPHVVDASPLDPARFTGRPLHWPDCNCGPDFVLASRIFLFTSDDFAWKCPSVYRSTY